MGQSHVSLERNADRGRRPRRTTARDAAFQSRLQTSHAGVQLFTAGGHGYRRRLTFSVQHSHGTARAFGKDSQKPKGTSVSILGRFNDASHKALTDFISNTVQPLSKLQSPQLKASIHAKGPPSIQGARRTADTRSVRVSNTCLVWMPRLS